MSASVWDDICLCGKPVTVRLYVNYKYPRTEWLPEAMDPHYVHGGGYSLYVCSPACEADAFLACREEIIDDHVLLPGWCPPAGLTAEQVAGLELAVGLSAGFGARVLGDDGDEES